VVLQPGQTLAELYAERVPLYQRYADIAVEEGQGKLEETVRAVYDSLKTGAGNVSRISTP
jgi:shikimate kinase